MAFSSPSTKEDKTVLPKVIYFFPEDANDSDSRAFRCDVVCGRKIEDVLMLFQSEDDADQFANNLVGMGPSAHVAYKGDKPEIRAWLERQRALHGAGLFAVDALTADDGEPHTGAIYSVDDSVRLNT